MRTWGRRVGLGICWLAAAGLLPCLSGCLGSSPSVRHFAMSPVSGQSVGAGAPEEAIALGPVDFARYLERPQMVTRVDGSELAFDEVNRWAGGFESNVVRVLADDLSMRLGATPVLLDAAGAPFAIRYRVAVDFERFEGHPGAELVLRARWSVREEGGGERVWHELSTLRQPVEGGDVASLVNAHDAALGQLADAIAARITAVGTGAP
jgi:uncharacterized lipoprotein YmbA